MLIAGIRKHSKKALKTKLELFELELLETVLT